MSRKPVGKATADSKAKAAVVKSVEKTTETKAAVKAEETAVKEEAKPVAVKEEKVQESKAVVKEEAKEPAKKTVKKATTGKKAAEKQEDLVPDVYVQYQGQEDVVKDVVERAKEAFVADGHRASSIKSLQLYLKPEESAAYYVVNQKYAGKVYLF